jgi:hypothetical protein
LTLLLYRLLAYEYNERPKHHKEEPVSERISESW